MSKKGNRRARRKAKFKKEVSNGNPYQRKDPVALSFYYHLRDIRGCGHFRAFKPMMALNNFDHPIAQTSAFATDRCVLAQGSYTNINFPIFQSVADGQYSEVMRQMRRMLDQNSYIVYDTDDNLFDIPDWNFAHDHYTPEVLEELETIMRSVDILSVSTPYLGERYSQYNKKVIVNPNRLIKGFWGEPQWEDKRNAKTRILYVGSDNHFSTSKEDDRGDFSMDFIKFVEDTLDKYQWVFVGGMPFTLRQYRGDKIEYYGWHSLLHLYPLLQSLNADVYLAPLAHNEFNKSKSNLKCMEATALGLPIVCTDIEPYKGMPGAEYSTEDFIKTLEKLAEDPDARKEMWKQQHDMLREGLFWEENENTLKYINNFTKEAYGFEIPYGMGNQIGGGV